MTHLSYTCVINLLPTCSECPSSGNFAYGWNTLCLRCVLGRIPLVCDQCNSTNISITNYWNTGDNPLLLTEYRCVECVSCRDLPPHTNFVSVSAIPSRPDLNVTEAVLHIIDTSTACIQCRRPHAIGTVLHSATGAGALHSICFRCERSANTNLPTTKVRLMLGGRFV